MTSVLGLPLERAVSVLTREGVTVKAHEVRSKKGVDGETEARVIRQDQEGDTNVTLLYAVFRVKPNEANA